MKPKELTESEDRLQTDWYCWFHNTYPQYRGLLCYNLNNSSNKIQGNKNKGMGLQKGRADLTLYWKGRAYHLECKTPEGTQKSDQKAWQAIIESNGFEYTIHRTKEDFIERVEFILNKI